MVINIEQLRGGPFEKSEGGVNGGRKGICPLKMQKKERKLQKNVRGNE